MRSDAQITDGDPRTFLLLIVDFVGVCTAALHDLAHIVEDVEGAVPVHTWAESAIASAREAGIAVVVLSNELDEATIERTPFFRTLDGTISLAHAAITKPDRRAFERVMLAHEVPAARTLVVDDSEDNVRGAQAAGATVLHFDASDPAGSWEAVRKELGIN